MRLQEGGIVATGATDNQQAAVKIAMLELL